LPDSNFLIFQTTPPELNMNTKLFVLAAAAVLALSAG
jgi:hypothetical protein